MAASLGTIFPGIPPMLCADAAGDFEHLDAAPVANLGLADGYTINEATGEINGFFQNCGSVLPASCPGLMDGCPVVGQKFDDGGFALSILLVSTAARQPRYVDFGRFPLQQAYLYVYSEQESRVSGSAIASTSVDLAWQLGGGSSHLVPYCHIQQLVHGYQETVMNRFVWNSNEPFPASLAEEGADEDIAALVSRELGFSPDFSDMLPSTVPYAKGVRVRSVTYRPPHSRSAGGEPTVCVELTYDAPEELADARPAALSSPVSLEHLSVMVGGVRNGSPDDLFVNVMGKVTMAGVPVDLFAEYPLWHVRADVVPLSPIPLSDVAKACGVTLPSLFENIALDQGRAQFDLGVGGDRGGFDPGSIDYDIGLAFTRADNRLRCALSGAADGGGVSFEYGSIEVRHVGGTYDVRVRGDVAFRDADGSYLFGLGAEGSLSTGSATSMTLSAYLRPDSSTCTQQPARFGGAPASSAGVALAVAPVPAYPSFAMVYAALTGRPAPAGCPSIEITRLSATLAYASSLSIEAFSAGLRVSTSDHSVFGCDLAFEALGSYSAGGAAVLSGSFLMEGRFSIAITVTLGNEQTSWEFALVIGSLRIDVVYGQGQLTATLNADVSLGDAVDALLRLFDWSAAFCRSGSWSFLNGIGLKGSRLSYDFASKRLRIDVKPRCSVPFLEMTDFAVVADPETGVMFEVVGTFEGESYPAANPLVFAPNDPPQPSGNALRVDYLAVADGIAVGDMATTSVEQALSQVQSVLNASTQPASLELDSRTGTLMAAAFTVAQCVEVKLVYCARTAFVGGRFKLYGSKAGPLASLEAELSYVKINNQLGVFSAAFVPPTSLRRISLGPLTVGVGSVAASIYTNGDFSINLGFPEKADFSHSFTLLYGMFDGVGGLYVKKFTTPVSDVVPATERGRFSPVLQLGVGMRIELTKGFREGILSANAYFSLQGIFEGVYATYLPNGSSASDSYYRMDATVALEGRLQGSVNFGLVGAAVTVHADAQAALRLEAYRPASVSVHAKVSASAQVTIWFARINFSFSLYVSIDFALGSGGSAPWSAQGQGSLAEHAVGAAALPPLRQIDPPRHLSFFATNAAPVTISCRVAPVYTRRDGQAAVAFLACVTARDFGRIVHAFAQFVEGNGYLGETCGLELFNASRLFAEPDALDKFVEERFVLEYSFADDGRSASSNAIASSDVLMPLPGFLVQTVTTRYVNGASDVSTADLAASFMVDEAFTEAMRAYYASTSEDNAQLERLAERKRSSVSEPQQPPVSLADVMFADYFELIVKSVRSVKHAAALRGEPFDATALADEQLSDIAGVVQHFFLGGHRVLEDGMEAAVRLRAARASGRGDAAAPSLVGNFEASGELMYLDTEDGQLDGYTFSFSPSATFPTWARLRDGDAIVRRETVATVRALLPAKAFAGESPFIESPYVSPFFADSPAAGFTLPATPSAEGFKLFEAGSQMAPGTRYTVEAGATAGDAKPVVRYAGVCELTLLDCGCATPLFAIVGAAHTHAIGLWRKAARAGLVESVSFAAMPADGDVGIRAQGIEGSFLLKGADGSSSVEAFAPVESLEAWFALLERACASEEPYYMGFPSTESCVFAGEGETVLQVVVRHAATDVFPEGFAAFAVEGFADEWLHVSPSVSARQAVIAQGRLAVSTLMSGQMLQEDERMLFNLYGSLAVRQTGEGRHETPPFAARRDTDGGPGRRSTVYMPYALDDEDVYASVRARRDLTFDLLWIDLLGNALADSAHAVSYRPRYIDDVVAFGAYPRVSAGFRLDAADGPRVVVDLTYRPYLRAPADGGGLAAAAQDDDRLADAVLQLEQPDVALTLSCPLCGDVPMPKPPIVAFLKGLISDPGLGASLAVPFPLLDKLPALTDVTASVTVERDAELVEEDAPDSVSRATTVLAYADAESECAPHSSFARNAERPVAMLSHAFSDAPESLAIYEGPDGYVALSANPPLEAEGACAYAFLPLPVVSGRYAAPFAQGGPVPADPPSVEMNGIDLHEILVTFLADLDFLMQPRQLARMAVSEGLRPLLDDLNYLRRDVGAALAGHIVPISSEATSGQVDTAASVAFAAAVTTHPDLDVLDALVLGADVRHRTPTETGLAVTGKAGEGSGLSTRIAPGDSAMGCVVLADHDPLDLASLTFRVKRLRTGSHAETEWLTPKRGPKGYDEVPLGLEGVVRLPGPHRPAPPALLSVLPAAADTTVSVQLAPFACDEAEYRLTDGMATTLSGVPPTSPLYWMERYRQDSPALIAHDSEENLQKLVGLMRSYVEALTAYGIERRAPAGDDPTVTLSFASDGESGLTGVRARGETDRIVSVSCRLAGGVDEPAVQTGDFYAFSNTSKPQVGELMALNLTFSNPADHQACDGWVRLAYRPDILKGGGATNPLFDQESATLWF